jgi:glycosyltransferase involved in cell wall biosynthesis
MNKYTKAIKILQIGNFPPPVCGWAIHTQAVQNALHQRGAVCVVLDIGPGRRTRQDEPDCTPMRGGFDFLFKIFAYRLRGYTFEPHVNGDSWKGYLLALAAVLLGRFTAKPSILMFHAGPQQQYFPRKKGLWFLAFQLLFSASGAIVCNLESVKKKIEKYGVSPQKVHAVFSVDYPQEKIPVPLPQAVEQFLQDHQPRLFSYTLFRPEFTPEVLFEAMAHVCKEFPGAGLLIAGPREVPAHITALIKEWGLESKVLISGNLAHAEFLTAIQRSDVFIRTHLRDGLCASVIEALSLGVPVVAAEDGIRPPSVITYDPPEARQLLATLTQVLKNCDEVQSRVQSPNNNGNLDTEISLLLSVASGEAR